MGKGGKDITVQTRAMQSANERLLENGCVPKGQTDGGAAKEIKVGEFAKDPKSCGVNVCQNAEGDAMVL